MDIGNYCFDRPVLYLAPMDDVTDAPFRDICHRMGADVTVSEFIASDALIREIEVIRRKLISGPDEHPFGIQIFGNNAESLCAAARL
ncbi:MAG: tRNA-dihydrouridine synthase, partial [Bacteroidales bacterium]|nr:tRNA-dihydrouridine synthase [Bacteroidales bacterium]